MKKVNAFSSQELYQIMKQENFAHVLYSVRKDNRGISQRKAEALLDAFLQWFSLIPFLPKGQGLQMLTSVDKVWHATIMHTAFYHSFCKKYIGTYVHHDPMSVENTTLEAKNQYATTTLTMLDAAFGSNVNIWLKKLEENLTCCSFTGKRKCRRRNNYVVN